MSTDERKPCPECGDLYADRHIHLHIRGFACELSIARKIYRAKGMGRIPDNRVELMTQAGIAVEPYCRSKFNRVLFFGPAWAARIVQFSAHPLTCLAWLTEISRDGPEQAARVTEMSHTDFIDMMYKSDREMLARIDAIPSDDTAQFKTREQKIQAIREAHAYVNRR